MIYTVSHYTINGKSPTLEWLKSNKISAQNKKQALAMIKTLEMVGIIGKTHALKGYPDIFQSEKSQLRMHFIRDPATDGYLVVHFFLKKSNRTDEDDINESVKRRDKYLESLKTAKIH